MPLGTEADLGPGDIVVDGNPALPPKKGEHNPQFWPMYWPNGCIDEDATWYGVGLGPAYIHIVLHVDPAPPKRGTAAPNSSSMSVVAKRLDRSRCHLVRR